MKIEDFKYELIPLRDLAHKNGHERAKLVRALLRYSPDDNTRFRIWAGMIVIVGGIAAGVIAGVRGINPFPILLCVGLAGVGSAVIGYGSARKRRVDSLIALSEKLNARAEALPVGEFERIAEMLSVAPEKDCCGCYGCINMLPKGEERCGICGARYIVYGDSEHPVDEMRLRRIHDLILEEKDET